MDLVGSGTRSKQSAAQQRLRKPWFPAPAYWRRSKH